jgi:hypothetical protein
VAQPFDFKNGVDDYWRSNGQALHPINQPHMAGRSAKNLDKQIRSSVRHSGMLCKLLRRRHQHRQLDELFEPVDIAKMFLCGRERVERGDARSFLAVFDERFSPSRPATVSFRLATGSVPLRKSKLPVPEASTEAPQWCRRRREHDSELAKARAESARHRFTTWRRHVLLHQFEGFRRSPSAPTANTTKHPQFRKLEPIGEEG